jgi:DNA-binding MarR family transcriptional regulator
MYNEQASIHGITVSVAYVLLSIDEQCGTPATHIGPLVGMESRSLTRTLNALEESNLITREHDTKDRRLVRIMLSPQGKLKRKIAKEVVKQFNHTIKSLIPEEKLSTFFEVIQQINQVVGDKKVYLEK